MRWLIVGPYPPSVDGGAAATLAAVRRLTAAGHEVVVVSPQPSAADRCAEISGLAGVARVGRLGRGFDGIHLRLGRSAGFTPSASPALAAAERAAARALIRSFDEAVVDVGNDDLHRMPGGRVGQLILGSGARFLVDDDDARRLLVERGADEATVSVREPLEPTAFTERALASVDGHRTPTGSSGTPLPQIERAAVEAWLAAVAGSAGGAVDEQDGGTAAEILRRVPPLTMPTPPVRGAKRVLARVVSRGTYWLVAPVVDHVNRLQAAMIDAAERSEVPRREPDQG